MSNDVELITTMQCLVRANGRLGEKLSHPRSVSESTLILLSLSVSLTKPPVMIKRFDWSGLKLADLSAQIITCVLGNLLEAVTSGLL